MANTDENNKNQINATKLLDDEQRVKVLSPGMLVTKRFLRNRLALIGLVIIVAMFAFAFIGGAIAPYGEREVFRTYETALKDYAGVNYNKDYQYTDAEGAEFPALAKADMILAINKGETSFQSGEVNYNLINEADGFYRVVKLNEVGSALTIKGISSFTETGNTTLTDDIKNAYIEASSNNKNNFDIDGTTYVITQSGKMNTISVVEDISTVTTLIFNTYSEDTNLSAEFKLEAQKAMVANETTFVADRQNYTCDLNSESMSAEFMLNGEEYASASHFNVKAISSDVFLTMNFKKSLENAIEKNESKLEYVNESGETQQYTIERNNEQYTVRNEMNTQVNSTYEAPSLKHWLGTDGNGMDVLTRLMFGGRISLLIGFVVVIIEIVLGILIGGAAGYFGGWIDSLLMRLVDVFNCIPAMPLYIILGAIMDFMKINPSIRIYFLCFILGILSWPQVARMVRGQILSLREQEFMTATEATGIRISRKIFKHLIPNVIPQLIVIATMGLGNVILMEATLSFFGLGVKYPYASWGNIINAVNDIYVMTNYWFIWIPAGFLILITVLGFNFIGDGLRDAFDPKMKR
ncbi:MAG: ABC transporter permease [Lachnotalea sp.]